MQIETNFVSLELSPAQAGLVMNALEIRADELRSQHAISGMMGAINAAEELEAVVEAIRSEMDEV